MEHGENSQSAPADKKSVGDTPGPSSPYHLSYTAAASAPGHDISEAAVHATLTIPAIDAMTDPWAFFGGGRSLEIQPLQSSPAAQTDAPQERRRTGARSCADG
jgi:hypothetical protein